jgi:hypothetical protein
MKYSGKDECKAVMGSPGNANIVHIILLQDNEESCEPGVLSVSNEPVHVVRDTSYSDLLKCNIASKIACVSLGKCLQSTFFENGAARRTESRYQIHDTTKETAYQLTKRRMKMLQSLPPR